MYPLMLVTTLFYKHNSYMFDKEEFGGMIVLIVAKWKKKKKKDTIL